MKHSNRNTTIPRIGCSTRASCGVPSTPPSQDRLGNTQASPDSATRKKQITSSQWHRRSGKPVRRIMVRLCMSLPLARAGRAAAIVAARGGGPVVVNLVLFGLARADADVVRQRAADGGQEANRGNRLEHVLPAFHYRTDLRVLGQPVVQ